MLHVRSSTHSGGSSTSLRTLEISPVATSTTGRSLFQVDVGDFRPVGRPPGAEGATPRREASGIGAVGVGEPHVPDQWVLRGRLEVLEVHDRPSGEKRPPINGRATPSTVARCSVHRRSHSASGNSVLAAIFLVRQRSGGWSPTCLTQAAPRVAISLTVRALISTSKGQRSHRGHMCLMERRRRSRWTGRSVASEARYASRRRGRIIRPRLGDMQARLVDGNERHAHVATAMSPRESRSDAARARDPQLPPSCMRSL
jgi:hypothetical protein